jgi:hypothetical protein
VDLKKQILKEHSKANREVITTYVGTSKKRFANLIDIYLAGPYRVTQRAAWPISYCVQAHPALIQPHLKKMLDFLHTPGVHGSVKRNTIRLLQFIHVPQKYQGRVAELCFKLVQDKGEAIAVKAHALTVLGNLTKLEPELLNELKLTVDELLPYASAGLRSRVARVMKSVAG